MSRTKRLLSALGWAWLAALLAVWTLGEWPGEKTVPTLLLAYAPPLFMLLPTVLLVLVAALGRSRAIIPALLALAFWPFYAGWQWHAPNAAAPGDLTLLTYNVAGASAGSPERLAREIAAARADIVTLQEAAGVNTDLTAALLAQLPGYEYAQDSQNHELLTLSRFPITESRIIPLAGTTRYFMQTTLQTPQGRLDVVNVHFTTALVSKAFRGGTMPTQKRREGQLRILLKETAGLSRVVVAGDFNTPPRGLMYRRLSHEFTDAWAAVGRGFGTTYPSQLPALQIDHAFMRGVQPVSVAVMPLGGSDHRALRVTLRP